MRLEGKRMVVMGVANKWSIAWHVASTLKEAGAEVIYTYFGEKSLASLEKLDPEGIFVACDVTDDASIERAFDEIGTPVDGVLHSIAHAKKEELEGAYYDTSRSGYLMAQEISAYSLVAVTRCARPYLTPGASIVTMTYYGGEKVVKNYNVMGVAKAALESSVKYLAHDLGPEGLRINAISAGPIKTLAAKGVSGFNDLAKGFIEKAPMHRLIEGAEIGSAALFLMSPMASGITGEVLHVDCGYHVLGY